MGANYGDYDLKLDPVDRRTSRESLNKEWASTQLAYFFFYPGTSFCQMP